MIQVEENATSIASLFWQVEGQGKDLVLLHGWGMNGAVWQQTVERLSVHFTVHVVDLPGYGYSQSLHAKDIKSMAEMVLESAPEHAIWVGWSLGGLIATQIALDFPERVNKLVTVASSPKFAAERRWKGIQPTVLQAFAEQLVQDFQSTVERFMGLQAMGSPTARQDVKALKKAIFSRPLPSSDALLVGLNMLANVDLRSNLSAIEPPFLRLYGRLDGLVPIKVAHDLEASLVNSKSYIFTQSSHAPFMTELDQFCQQIVQFAGNE
ncbi:pimeloyl-ACP methyl ester esterase BioH [Vibrio sp. TH_r3]|uniref:pimeloyl-ACP methyl ester esterase BioH n=1 Tax=Vibrio sp. TH_r3 TaxID=3082084 RepID=UPI002954444A|nr:pimeloyl-ACP methyl ester esterase BioH [Vibrio sp. TH_r3]MDV7104161.1 pimeloyl-ACP methyl ester esterase BioH [Vibrio sp. TH_r3]